MSSMIVWDNCKIGWAKLLEINSLIIIDSLLLDSGQVVIETEIHLFEWIQQKKLQIFLENLSLNATSEISARLKEDWASAGCMSYWKRLKMSWVRISLIHPRLVSQISSKKLASSKKKLSRSIRDCSFQFWRISREKLGLLDITSHLLISDKTPEY